MSFAVGVRNEPQTLRSGAVTNSYDASPVPMRVQNANQTVWYLNVTLGSATDVRVQFDLATPTVVNGQITETKPAVNDPSWYTLVYQGTASSAGGVATIQTDVLELKFTASNTYAIQLPLNAKWARIRAKCTGTTTGCTLGVVATTGMI